MKVDVEAKEVTATITVNEKELRTLAALVGGNAPISAEKFGLKGYEYTEMFKSLKDALEGTGIKYIPLRDDYGRTY